MIFQIGMFLTVHVRDAVSTLPHPCLCACAGQHPRERVIVSSRYVLSTEKNIFMLLSRRLCREQAANIVDCVHEKESRGSNRIHGSRLQNCVRPAMSGADRMLIQSIPSWTNQYDYRQRMNNPYVEMWTAEE